AGHLPPTLLTVATQTCEECPWQTGSVTAAAGRTQRGEGTRPPHAPRRGRSAGSEDSSGSDEEEEEAEDQDEGDEEAKAELERTKEMERKACEAKVEKDRLENMRLAGL
ncbi:MAG: hypothetical protein ACPIOQ_43200, partial [Promethearchaeia archaeon]